MGEVFYLRTVTTSSTDAGASPLRRYVSSGRTPLSGLILGLLTGFLVALVLGALYATAIVHVPQLMAARCSASCSALPLVS